MSHTTWLHSHLDTDNDISSAIKDMVKEKGSTCVSIIVPTHRFGQDRQADVKEVQRAVLAAKESVSSEEKKILSGIDDLFDRIDFTRNKDGIGIFVSPRIKKLVKFPFPVTKKIIVTVIVAFSDSSSFSLSTPFRINLLSLLNLLTMSPSPSPPPPSPPTLPGSRGSRAGLAASAR